MNAKEKELRAAAGAPAPTAGSARVKAAVTGHYLSLFNLSPDAVTTTVSVPRPAADDVHLYEGDQTVTGTGTDYRAELGAAAAVLLPPRIALSASGGRSGIPAGLRAEVADGRTVRLSGPPCRVVVSAQGHRVNATVRAGRSTTVTVPRATGYPLADLALGRTTFPTAPLPPGMTDPGAAVDGDPRTAWRPGPGGRMVVDLGDVRRVTEIRAEWRGGHGPVCHVEFSSDGLTYGGAVRMSARGVVRTSATARYVALAVGTTAGRDIALTSLTVTS